MHFSIWNKSIDVSLSGHKSFRGFLPMRPKHIVYITIRYIYLGLNKMYFFLILCYIKKNVFTKQFFFSTYMQTLVNTASNLMHISIDSLP